MTELDVAGAHRALEQLQRDIDRQKVELTEKGAWDAAIEAEHEQIRLGHAAVADRVAEAQTDWGKSKAVVQQEIAAVRGALEKWAQSVDERFARGRRGRPPGTPER